MKKIELSQGKFSIVDDDMYDYLNQWKWTAHKSRGKWYAQRRNGIHMHHIVMGLSNYIEIDHINGDSLDNRVDNLRTCTHVENSLNRGKQSNNTSGYKGVSFDKSSQRYKSYITINGKTMHLGLYDDPIKAAKVYDAFAKQHHGIFAKLNFPSIGEIENDTEEIE